jgi:tRNA(Ser,Leu) C12 N-acetylase TAN1
MLEWNVVVTAHEHRYRHARRLLMPLGEVGDTDYFNVLVMRVDAPHTFLDLLMRELTADPNAASCLVRVLPVTVTFPFQSPREFERKAAEAALGWLDALGDSRFHVRMHRRGFKRRLSSLQEEHFLDHLLLDALQRRGREGVISFTDPDWILALDTVGQRAGLSLWSREQLQRYPLLRLD